MKNETQMNTNWDFAKVQHAQVQHIPGICRNCCWFDAGKHEPGGEPSFGLCRKSAPKTNMIGEMNLPDEDDHAKLRIINEQVFQEDSGRYPSFQFFTEPIWPKVYEDDFCGKFKCADWARRKDQQGRMLLPMKVFHPNHPDYFKLFPSDDDDCTQEI
jgi:hypothetical protein